jgi:hypothetical protein
MLISKISKDRGRVKRRRIIYKERQRKRVGRRETNKETLFWRKDMQRCTRGERQTDKSK